MGGVGGVQRPILNVTEPKKTGARSARKRLRGQNPLVIIIIIINLYFPPTMILQYSKMANRLHIIQTGTHRRKFDYNRTIFTKRSLWTCRGV